MSQQSDIKVRALQGLADSLRRLVRDLSDSIQRRREEVLDSQGRMQSRYDTARIEGSWDVDAQTARCDRYRELLALVENRIAGLAGETARWHNPVVAVRATGDSNAPVQYFLLAPVGGVTVEVDGRRLCTVSPAAPLGRELCRCRPGDVAEVRSGAGTRWLDVLDVW